MSAEMCELDKEEYPMVGELAHRTGSCYCYLCTCSKHECPSQMRSVSLNSKSNYLTSYQSNYQERKTVRPVPYIREGELSHSRNKMQFHTTQKDNYPTYKTPSPSINHKKATFRPSVFKFNHFSTYNKTYVDSKNYHVPPKPIQLSYDPSPLQLSATTTYKKNFDRKYRPRNSPIRLKDVHRDIVGIKNFQVLDTTNQLNFKAHSHSKSPFKQQLRTELSQLMESPKIHFNTTYSDTYIKYIARKPVLTLRQKTKLEPIIQ